MYQFRLGPYHKGHCIFTLLFIVFTVEIGCFNTAFSVLWNQQGKEEFLWNMCVLTIVLSYPQNSYFLSEVISSHAQKSVPYYFYSNILIALPKSGHLFLVGQQWIQCSWHRGYGWGFGFVVEVAAVLFCRILYSKSLRSQRTRIYLFIHFLWWILM
jgi:hypothetical protein